MTDEEKAENYAKGLCKICTFDTCRHNALQTCAIKESLKQAHLAGLKAGKNMAEADLATIAYMQGAERDKTKWHDLRKNPNDLPESSIFHEILNQNGTKMYYDDILKKWNMYFNGKIVQAQTPIAWCEIPTFTDKE